MGGDVGSIYKIYGNPRADAIAQDLKISQDTYWLSFNEMSKHLDDMTDEYVLASENALLPLFPAEVYQYEELFSKAAKQEGIPINILAIITTIESAGVSTAKSAAGAIGLNQVMVRWHRDKIKEIASKIIENLSFNIDEELTEALFNPEVNIMVSAAIFREYLNLAQKAGHDRNKPSTTARVFAAYNSGPDALKKDYYEWNRLGDAIQTQLYALYALTFMLDAEVAARMRADGANDIEIRHALSSDKLAATVWAYIKQGENMEWKGSKDVKDYEYRRSTLLSLPESKVAIVEHMRQDHKFMLENLPIALRIWMVHGGLGLFGRSAENMNPINYR